MKKIFSISLAILALAACTRVEIEIPESNKAITFGNSFVAYATRAAEIQESNFAEFSVWADQYNPTQNTLVPLFEGNPVKKTGSVWNSYSTTDPNTIENKYWIPTLSYYFAAVAPIKSKVAGVGNIVTDFDLNIDRAAANQKYIGGSFDFTNTGEDDLIFSTYYKEEYKANTNDPDNNKVNFTFKHLLSKVRVSFANQVGSDIDLQISDVTIQAQRSATYNISSESWTIDDYSDTDNFSFKEYTNLPILTSSGTGSVGTTESLFLIPSNKYSIAFNVTLSIVDANGDRKVIYTGVKTANLTADDLLTITQKNSLEKGSAYNFIINVTPQRVVNDDSFEIDDIRQEDWNAFSLSSQISIASKLGGIITLTAPVEIPNTIDVIDDLIINLNGYTLTYTKADGSLFNVVNKDNITNNDDKQTSLTINGNDKDNSSIVTTGEGLLATANSGGNIVINGGNHTTAGCTTYLAAGGAINVLGGKFIAEPLTTSIYKTLDIDNTKGGTIIISKGSFYQWDPANSANGDLLDKSIEKLRSLLDMKKEYYVVDKLRTENISSGTEEEKIQNIKNFLNDPHVDTVKLDVSIDNGTTGLAIRRDVVIDGKGKTYIGGAAGENGTSSSAWYNFEIYGPYNVVIKNVNMIGGGVYGYLEKKDGVYQGLGPNIVIENCSITANWNGKTGRNAIYVYEGSLVVKNTDVTIGTKSPKQNYVTLVNSTGIIIKDQNVNYTPKEVIFSKAHADKPGFDTNNGGHLYITGGTFDKDPTTWVPNTGEYTITETGSNWVVTGPIYPTGYTGPRAPVYDEEGNVQ